jgi:predicted nuclease of predicted toxin-antitoxin system
VAARLLLDENLSERLLPLLIDLFPGSTHVRGLGRGGASDTSVWEMARGGGYLLLAASLGSPSTPVRSLARKVFQVIKERCTDQAERTLRSQAASAVA